MTRIPALTNHGGALRLAHMVVLEKEVGCMKHQFRITADLRLCAQKGLIHNTIHVVAISMGMFHQCQKENLLVSNSPNGEFQTESTWNSGTSLLALEKGHG